MRRGISHSGIDEQRSSDLVASQGSPPEDDSAQAASWTTRLVREVTGERTTVHLVLPDLRGRLRVIWREGERVHMGPEATARRQMAFESLTSSHHEPSSSRLKDQQRWLGFFPLHRGERPLGVLEVVAPADVLRRRWENLSAMADQLALRLEELAERDRLRRAIVSLEEDAELRGELLAAEEPEAALQIAADSIARGSGVPIGVWWCEHQGPLAFTVASGVTDQARQDIRRRIGTIPSWGMLTSQERTSLRGLFGAAVGAKQVSAREVDGAVLMVGSGEPELRRRIRAVGSLLEEALPLLAATARERRRNMEIDLGLAWTAHELSGPLLSIKAALELLISRGSSGGDPLLASSLRELEQLVGDMEGILGWAVGSRPLSPSFQDVTQLVEATVDPYRKNTSSHTIEVIAPRPAMAEVDPTHLRAAVGNLVRNAVAYSDPGGAVVVEIVDEGTRLRLSVRDQGPGIPVGERETIFDPFVRGEAGSRRGRGSGLGLFITRRVVEAHGGTVWLDPGYPGADFQMVLPVDRREAPRFAS
jgi:signal transduction histidine kinase